MPLVYELGVCKSDPFYWIVQSRSVKWLHSLHCVVSVATMYTNACRLHLLKRSLLVSGTQVRQVVTKQNAIINVHTAHCAFCTLWNTTAKFSNSESFLLWR